MDDAWTCAGCAHRNEPSHTTCAACGRDNQPRRPEHTLTLAKVDPLFDAPGPDDDLIVDLDEITPGRPILVARGGVDEGDFFELRDDVTRIGRSPDNSIVLDDVAVSRHHCEIIAGSGRFTVRDLGSLNGTYVNRGRVEQAVLAHEDELQVGRFRLVFLEHRGVAR